MSDKVTLNSIEDETTDPKSLVSLRMKLLEQDGPGFPSIFFSLVQRTSHLWFDMLSSRCDKTTILLANDEKTNAMSRTLCICRNICIMDPCVREELGSEGLHIILSKIMNIDPYEFHTDEDQDIVMEVQDLACEIASMYPTFPMRVAPFSQQELQDRLPLIFAITPVLSEGVDTTYQHDGVTILINQVKARQSSQADVGFLMWPSAVVLSRYLLTNPDLMFEKDVLEIGCGCGLTGLVAGKIIALQDGKKKTSVLLTDFNSIVVKNCESNISLNRLNNVAKSEQLDFYKQDITLDGWLDSSGSKRQQVDLIVAADVICQPDDAFAVARTIFCALKSGGKAIVVSADSKHRFGVERFEEACQVVHLRMSLKRNIRDIYDGRLLCSNMEKTTGYIENMSLTMYIVEKL